MRKARTSKIPRREEQRLLTYAAAAGAVLAAAGTADAAIHYSGLLVPDQTVSNVNPYPFGLGVGLLSHNVVVLGIRPTGTAVALYTSGTASFLNTAGGWAQKLSSKDDISSPVSRWTSSWVHMFGKDGSGNFSLGSSGYIGFRFDSSADPGSQWNYGWVQIDDVVSNLTSDNSYRVVDWAYQDDGTGIAAGATGGGGPSGGGGGGSDGGSVGAPEPGTVLMGLSALAIGAGYRMRQWRRKRA